MRLYCLSRFCYLRVDEAILTRQDGKNDAVKNDEFIIPIPYNDEDDEINIDFEEFTQFTPENILKNSNDPDHYQLTEICIGYENLLRHYEDNLLRKYVKAYFVNIYRKDTKLYQIPMLRGVVSIKKVKDEDNVFDLRIFTNGLYDDLELDLGIRIRCIKNTGTKGKISKEEEKIYEKYAEMVNEYGHGSEDLQEEAFKKFPFELPDTKTEKPLKQRITDLLTLIDLLCNPETGSFKNIPKPEIIYDPETRTQKYLRCRFDQKLKYLLIKNKEWIINNTPNNVEAEAKHHTNCTSIVWMNGNLQNVELNGTFFKRLRHLTFDKTKIVSSDNILFPCLNNFNFACLTTLELDDCGLSELSDNFVVKLSPNLKKLNLARNDITRLSSLISGLTSLETLNLDQNNNLDDKGMPWKDLPKTIKSLEMNKTNITTIPPEIRKLRNLREAFITSRRLKHVSWKDISETISELLIEGGDMGLNDPELADKDKLQELHVTNASLKEIDYCKLPSSLHSLSLDNSKITCFQATDSLSDLLRLSLYKNCVKEMCWETLPPTLINIDIAENQLKFIGNISHLTELSTIAANCNQIEKISTCAFELMNLTKLELSRNKLESLPEGFETMKSLVHLDISHNLFNYDSNLDSKLWKRLPKSLQILYLNNNNILQISCFLENIENMAFNNCQLHHICPYLYTKAKNFATVCKKKKYDEFCHYSEYRIKSDNKKLHDTTKFPTKLRKPVYDFRVSSDSYKYACKCCALCGEITDEPVIEQQMVMDCSLFFATEAARTLDQNDGNMNQNDSVLDFVNNLKPELQSYSEGKWKTNIKTRLCKSCKEKFITKTDKAFEKVNRKKDKSSVSQKRRNIEIQEEKAKMQKVHVIETNVDTTVNFGNDQRQLTSQQCFPSPEVANPYPVHTTQQSIHANFYSNNLVNNQITDPPDTTTFPPLWSASYLCPNQQTQFQFYEQQSLQIQQYPELPPINSDNSVSELQSDPHVLETQIFLHKSGIENANIQDNFTQPFNIPQAHADQQQLPPISDVISRTHFTTQYQLEEEMPFELYQTEFFE